MSPTARRRTLRSRLDGLRARLVSLWQPRAIILLYHRVVPGPVKNDWLGLKTSSERFEGHLRFLLQRYRLVSLRDLVLQLQNGHLRAHRQIVITFDDGYDDNFYFAYPLLKRFRAPATIFLSAWHLDSGEVFWWDRLARLVSGTSAKTVVLPEPMQGEHRLATPEERRAAFLAMQRALRMAKPKGRDLALDRLRHALGPEKEEAPEPDGRPLTWEAVRQMLEGGVSFGAHGCHHFSLPLLDDTELEVEVKESKALLEAHLGQPVLDFAYPFGGRLDFDPRVRETVRRSGFESACSTIRSPIGRISDPFTLPRITVGNVEVGTLARSLRSLFSWPPA